jgi:uncharacterized protein YecE (DUF72 family)
MGTIKIGCCGFSGYQPQGAWQKRYASKLQAYAAAELKELGARLRALAGYHETVYCMFNNTGMFVNARKLKQMI